MLCAVFGYANAHHTAPPPPPSLPPFSLFASLPLHAGALYIVIFLYDVQERE